MVCFQSSRVFEHLETKSLLSRRAGGDTNQESARRRQQVLPVQEAPGRVRNTGTRASVKRTQSRAVEAARECTPQNVSVDTPFQCGERALISVKINFFEQSEYTMYSEESVSGDDVH